MISFARHAIALALILCSVAFFVHAQSQTKMPKKGSVAGKVTIKGKSAPGIVVGLRSSDPAPQYEPSFKATTDEDGNFRITDVPAGTYQVAPVAPAFVISNANNSRGETVVLNEGEIVEGIDFALVRGGVITGKVTDAQGRPVVEQRMSLVTADATSNQRDPEYSARGVQTDDRGVYRMFGIRAGRYKVAAGQDDDNFYKTVSGRPSYKQTFYPNVSDASKATVVEVTEGSEAGNIDITVGRATQTFAASGRIVDGENGKPIEGARFGLQLMTDERQHSYVGNMTPSNSQGEFRLDNLPPGKYAVFLVPQEDSNLRSDAVAFEIVDQDLNGILVKTSNDAASLAGTIILENTEDKAALAKLMRLGVYGYVENPAPSSHMGHSSTINSDGSFSLNGLEPGTLHISIWAEDRNLMKGFVVSRIERNGIIEARGIDVKNGDRITGVRVVVSYGSATIHGVVKLDNGMLPAGARIYMRVTKEGETRSNIRSPEVDARGHFSIEGIPGGLYDFETNVFLPGTVGKPRPPVKQQVNVADGVVTDVTITLDMNPNPGSSTP